MLRAKAESTAETVPVLEIQAIENAAGADPGQLPPQPEVSVVMPCLNEAETLARCIEKALGAFRADGIEGEVVIADNGSTDGSQEIATRLGARVVPVAARGYGNALRGGIAAARGTYVIMGDSDDSYDFSAIEPIVRKLREGHDLVMGNRFRGGIMPGAMPWKHKWIGNPVLSGLGRLFFRCPIGDFHCGLRGFSKAAYEKLDLQTTGMEFASEMVIKSTLLRQKFAEVPIILYKDGRSRPPHLRSWRDGWRHLRFMLLFSPRWLFFYPGAFLFLAGVLLTALLWMRPVQIGAVTLDIHSMLVAAFTAVIGYQLVAFALFAKLFAVSEGLHPTTRLSHLPRGINLEFGVVAGLVTILAGAALVGSAVFDWGATGFGVLDPQTTMREVIPGVALLVFGGQTIFASFFLGILTLRRRRTGS
jgi:glycosyltransferase involved in cell wall biosynthesis